MKIKINSIIYILFVFKLLIYKKNLNVFLIFRFSMKSEFVLEFSYVYVDEICYKL